MGIKNASSTECRMRQLAPSEVRRQISACAGMWGAIVPARANDAADKAAIAGRLQHWAEAFNARDAAASCDLFAPDLIATMRGLPERGCVCAQLAAALADRNKRMRYAERASEAATPPVAGKAASPRSFARTQFVVWIHRLSICGGSSPWPRSFFQLRLRRLTWMSACPLPKMIATLAVISPLGSLRLYEFSLLPCRIAKCKGRRRSSKAPSMGRRFLRLPS